ncbi:MAG: 50S ribosomal protein L4 [Bacilli bacterium]|jgi:large subunit ribosomal protein L4
MAEKKSLSLKVYSMSGEAVGNVSLDASVFAIEPHKQAVHDAIVVYNSNLRQDTAKTKKRDEVSGGGKKPWKQKGTGRARAGSIRSPLWVGGGRVFGPTGVQNHKLSQNKKEHALALKSALSEKAKKGFIVVDEWKLNGIKTKEFVEILKNLKAEGKSLIIIDEDNVNLISSARNLKNVGITAYDNVAVYDLMYFDNILISKLALKKIEEALK